MTAARSATTATDETLTVDATVLAALVREVQGSDWNVLSPLRAEFARDTEPDQQTRQTLQGLRDNAQLRATAKMIAQPDVRVTLRFAAPGQEPSAYVACLRRDAGELVAIVLPQGGRTISVGTCPDLYSFIISWAALVASRTDTTIPNDLPPCWPLKDLLLALHAVDCYRRARRAAELSYVAQKRITIGAREFAKSLATASASDNTSLLLPAFLTVTPGVDHLDLAPNRENLVPLFERRILEMSDSQGENTLGFGECGERMGEEFINGLTLSCGFETAIWSEGTGALPVVRAYLTSTPGANHLIEISTQADGTAIANHQAMTQRQLMARLVGLHSAALDDRLPAITKPAAVAMAKPARAAAPGPINEENRCPNCRQPAAPGEKFCTRCGSRI